MNKLSIKYTKIIHSLTIKKGNHISLDKVDYCNGLIIILFSQVANFEQACVEWHLYAMQKINSGVRVIAQSIGSLPCKLANLN